jgi:hypothetical protein
VKRTVLASNALRRRSASATAGLRIR